MGWFRRLRGARDKAPAPAGGRAELKAGMAHLEEFVASRHGVEAYLEPRTTVTEPTVLLIAHDGEWTRRRIGSPEAAYACGKRLGIPVYDANLVGYPQRMRDYNERQKRAGSS